MESIVKEFLKIPTTCISDVMNGLNNMNPAIKPLEEDYRFAGRAFNVKIPVGDNLAVLKAIREAKSGDVLVIDAKGDLYRAIAGDFIVGMAQTLGISAIVVDGVIRDIKGVKKLNFPVFSRGTSVAASGKAGTGEINIPISCGGTAVNPGDIIVGDADGVVVIPQSEAQAILEKAVDKLKKDEIREKNVAGNVEAIKKYLDDMTSN
ncbi:RraA family protein [Heyndrickxia acidicola]|uniref:Putative 4-hydroxy-4-methyl-2-oxoglutarate aldolase n=1 Tax=Heyndrickxia acidicola TaxID=209389 RepID=A0ABU6MM43_9BACI|nr:regulator [Heyndrickxia acidicola]MED1205751.1 RraA family protein [Heyndrickxia acidicola]